MTIPIKHQAVNWIDGMKLSCMHFAENDAYHADALRDMAHLLLNDFNYGLLPPFAGMHSSLEYDLSPNRDRFEVIVRSCNAITRGGVRILLHPNMQNRQQVSASVNASDYEGQEQALFAVVITANPFTRMPVGEPDPEESPLRHPHTMPVLKLEIVPKSLINLNYTEGHNLVVGNILWRDKQFSWVDSYIPPCSVTASHRDLISRHESFDVLQNGLRNHSISIMDTIHRKEATKRPDYDAQLTGNTAQLCGQMLQFLADTSFAFKNATRAAPPILLIQQASRLAGRLFAALNLMPANEREKLLAYYSQWTDIQPVQFLQTLSQMIDLQYDHLNIVRSMIPSEKFMTMVSKLWERLSRLEFIGQNEKSLVLGVESEYRNSDSTKHNLLD